jgi:hypothetical protein
VSVLALARSGERKTHARRQWSGAVERYEFVMRCWTHAELQSLLSLNGFGSVTYFGAYDPAVAPGVTDRLVAVAQRSTQSA